MNRQQPKKTPAILNKTQQIGMGLNRLSWFLRYDCQPLMICMLFAFVWMLCREWPDGNTIGGVIVGVIAAPLIGGLMYLLFVFPLLFAISLLGSLIRGCCRLVADLAGWKRPKDFSVFSRREQDWGGGSFEIPGGVFMLLIGVLLGVWVDE